MYRNQHIARSLTGTQQGHPPKKREKPEGQPKDLWEKKIATRQEGKKETTEISASWRCGVELADERMTSKRKGGEKKLVSEGKRAESRCSSLMRVASELISESIGFGKRRI